MKKLVLIFAGLLLIVQAGLAQVPPELDHYFTNKIEPGEPGVAVLVVQNDKILLRKGYGRAEMSPSVDIKPETVFRIASITKQFTSVAILKLVSEGKLSLDDDVTKYLPELNTHGETVTIRHFLHHTSGIKSYTSLPNLMTPQRKGQPVTNSEVMELVNGQKMDFEPSEAYLYNNSGYYLLGVIIEKVSGKTYMEYLQTHFFKPFKMKSTHGTDGLKKLHAVGYGKSGDGYERADFIHSSIPFAAGMLYSTVDDLWKWNREILKKHYLPHALEEQALEPLTLNVGNKQNYAMGWGLGRLGKAKVIQHGGAIEGFMSFAMYEPESDLFVCVLSNNMSLNPEGLAYDVAELALDIATKDLAIKEMEPSQLDEYVGVYEIGKEDFRVISREGTKMYSQRNESTKFEIVSFDTDAFYFVGSPSRIHFVRDASGKISGMEMHGRTWLPDNATKTSDKAPPVKQEVEINPEVFDAYTGQYELAPGFVLKFWRDGATYWTQATGQQAIQIFPESETTFFMKVVVARVEFKQDHNGRWSEVVLFQGGREMPAKRVE
jgi:CubicO group peptidase (beta-lactamase class C family)